MFYLYILKNDHNRLYIGRTNNLQRRLQDHQNDSGAKFIREYGGFELIYSEEYPSRVLAIAREKQLKKWTIAKKEALISGDLGLLKTL